jgi:undecaprenyl-diphosphatase
MESIPSIDKNLVVALAKFRVSSITSFMKLMTRIGDGYVWTGLCIIIAAFNAYAGFVMIFASLTQIILQQIAKHIFCRERPFVAHDDIFYIIPPPDKFSFPSGHTAAAFVMVFAIFHFYPIFFGIMLLIACLIALSRVYLGLHYPTDIFGGIFLGYISYKVGLAIANLIILYKYLHLYK